MEGPIAKPKSRSKAVKEDPYMTREIESYIILIISLNIVISGSNISRCQFYQQVTIQVKTLRV